MARAIVPLPTPPGPMRTNTDVSATKASVQFGPLLWPEATNATGLGNVRFLHDAPCFDIADVGQCTHEIERPHLSNAVFNLSERKELLEREPTGLYQFLHFRTTSPVGHRQSRRRDTLFLR